MSSLGCFGVNRSRLHLTLTARSDLTYDSAYHHKLRGCIWQLLEDTSYWAEHDQQKPLGITYTNPIPWGDAKEGDKKTLTISATREPVLAEIAKAVQANPEFNIGQMPFRVTDLTQSTADVGEPGTTGTIETNTGVYVAFDPEEADEYGITPDGDDEHFWRDSDPLTAFSQKIEDNLQTKWELLDLETQFGGPCELKGPVFNSYQLMKTFWTPLTVTAEETRTTCLSKWTFNYTVRSEAHREVLNTALAAGIGERNGLGLGSLEITTQTPPGRQPAKDTQSAHQ